MARLQSLDLTMIGVGTTGEPALRAGVHLRWSFRTRLGFPSYGFALYRKPSPKTKPICFDAVFAGRGPTANAGYRIQNQDVTIYSDLPLRLTEQVAPAGQVEVDLFGRRSVRIAFAVPQKRVTLTVFATSTTTVSARATWGGGLVDSRSVNVAQGVTTRIVLRFDSIDEVVIDEAAGLLVDACGEPLFPDAYVGWQQIPGFAYPLALPVTHTAYPATGFAPENQRAYEIEARKRVQVPGAPPLPQDMLDEAYVDLIDLVAAGPPQHQRSRTVVGVPSGVDAELKDNEPEITVFPLQNALMAALRPEGAQMLGLYWLDGTVRAGENWDYLLLGFWTDPRSAFGAGWKWELRDQLVEGLPDGVLGYIVTEMSLQSPASIAAPEDVRAYHLPGLTSRQSDGGLRDWQNNVGLRWQRNAVDGRLLPREPIFFHVYRADLGQGATPQDPHRADYGKPITGAAPILITLPPATLVPQRPPHWPDFSLHYIDRGVVESWYGYRIQSIDIFGRASVLSDPADWHDFDPPALRRRDAIQVIDRMPPPPPGAVAARVLQAGDPYLSRADNTWLANEFTPDELEQGAAGLRINWEWPENLKRQAPDMAPGGAFRLYFQTGLLNAEAGTIESNNDRGNTSEAVWFQSESRPAGYYTGGLLQSRSDLFRITGSTANASGQTATLTVQNLSPAQLELKKTPVTGRASVIFPAGHTQHKDYALPATPAIWERRFHTHAYNPALVQYEIRLRLSDVNVPRFAVSEQSPIMHGAVGVTAVDTRGNESAIGGPAPVILLLRTPPEPPTLPPDAERVWATRSDYHGHSHYTFRWNGQQHLSYLVCRAMDISLFRHNFIDSKGVFTYDVRRADYNNDPLNHPDFAGVWPDELNEMIPPSDFSRREIVTAELNALWNSLDPIRAQLQPTGLSSTERAVLIDSALALYRRLSNDALRMLASLPENAPVFTRVTPQPLDHRNLLPDSSSPSLYAYTDRLDGRGRNRYFYRARSIDGAHNTGRLGLSSPPVYMPDEAPPAPVRLAKVLGGEREARLSWGPHPPGMADRYLIYRTDSKEMAADVRLMGDPVAEVLAQPLTVTNDAIDFGAAIDVETVEGIYTAAVFDPDADLLSQPGANLLLGPTSPVGGRITGLAVTGGTEVVAVYHDSRDGVQVTAYRNTPRHWRDAGLMGGRSYFYRIVAVRQGQGPSGLVEIRSSPSAAGAARVVEAAPEPPTITTIEWVRLGVDGTVHPYQDPVPAGEIRKPAVRLIWSSTTPDLSCMVQVRNQPNGEFTNASAWLPRGVYELVHPNFFRLTQQEYRVKVLSRAGHVNTEFIPAILGLP